VATGPGFLLREIGKALPGHLLIAQDQAQPMLTIATKEAQAEGVKLQTVNCPAEHISLSSGDVDVVTCKQFLHEAGDVDTALTEMHRILKPGGRMFLIDFDRNGSKLAAMALRLLMTVTRGHELGSNFWKSYRSGLAGEDVRQRLIKLGLANVEYQCVGCNYLVMGTKR
jgi:ubiquinone/menaquinone biosynthesis C-methylase UbiE